jgi:hypothetical protein
LAFASLPQSIVLEHSCKTSCGGTWRFFQSITANRSSGRIKKKKHDQNDFSFAGFTLGARCCKPRNAADPFIGLELGVFITTATRRLEL